MAGTTVKTAVVVPWFPSETLGLETLSATFESRMVATAVSSPIAAPWAFESLSEKVSFPSEMLSWLIATDTVCGAVASVVVVSKVSVPVLLM